MSRRADAQARCHCHPPVAARHQTETALNIGALKAAGADADTEPLDDVSGPHGSLRTALEALCAVLAKHAGDTAIAEATLARNALLPAMTAARLAAETLEDIVADDLWPLPTDQEMLFVL